MDKNGLIGTIALLTPFFITLGLSWLILKRTKLSKHKRYAISLASASTVITFLLIGLMILLEDKHYWLWIAYFLFPVISYKYTIWYLKDKKGWNDELSK